MTYRDRLYRKRRRPRDRWRITLRLRYDGAAMLRETLRDFRLVSARKGSIND